MLFINLPCVWSFKSSFSVQALAEQASPAPDCKTTHDMHMSKAESSLALWSAAELSPNTLLETRQPVNNIHVF